MLTRFTAFGTAEGGTEVTRNLSQLPQTIDSVGWKKSGLLEEAGSRTELYMYS